MTNCTSAPGLIVPSRTSRAPIQSTATIEAKTRKMTIALSAARVADPPPRRVVGALDEPPKAARLAGSWV